jgi:two-component system, sensor histidine kinase and response regulator
MLYDCLTKIGGYKSLEAQAPLVTNHVLLEEKKRKRLLMAEDNIVNQKVGRLVLEKLGYYVDVVGNGLEAVKAVGEVPYDLILMDVQMPEMDGFEATAAIRQQETESDKHIPIIALTAHAMSGDKEHCLAAGMDEYVSKPIKPHEVEAAIKKLLSHSHQEAISVIKVTGQDSAFNHKEFLERVGGDFESAEDLLTTFLEITGDQIEKIRVASENQDINKVKNLAHAMKGAAASIAGAFKDVAGKIELAGKKDDPSLVPELLIQLNKEFAKLQKEVTKYLNQFGDVSFNPEIVDIIFKGKYDDIG